MTEEQKSTDSLPPGCGLWFSWFFASILGSLLGWLIGWQGSFFVPGALSTIVLGALMGTSLGIMQWLVLRGHINQASWWVPASAAGWAAGFTIGVSLAHSLSLAGIEFGVTVGVITGAFLGLSQWLVLRNHVTQAGWWVLASIFAWASGLLYYQPGVSWIGALYGTLTGMVTGLALLWLFYRPVSDEGQSVKH